MENDDNQFIDDDDLEFMNLMVETLQESDLNELHPAITQAFNFDIAGHLGFTTLEDIRGMGFTEIYEYLVDFLKGEGEWQPGRSGTIIPHAVLSSPFSIRIGTLIS